tara:strand:+ start:306 stop:1259 length:954 start_codon:yes stop_codon:yes gene_type:complete
MGFLDNSGDIILDAVLTDTGRKRLARGDGSFNVAKFALGDDEINYQLYNKTHDSGSAYYDIDILQTPVLEAFTNNTSTMKSKLITISRTNILYLPILKLNTDGTNINIISKDSSQHSSGLHLIAVDKDTRDKVVQGTTGVIDGYSSAQQFQCHVAIDQGIDHSSALNTIKIDPDLEESQYIIQIDHRLGRITSADGATVANYSFLDDDNIATYYMTISSGQNTGYITSMDPQDPNSTQDNSVLAGKRGSRLQFSIKASEQLTDSTYYFDRLGASPAQNNVFSGDTHYTIDTTIRIMGATTGYAMELPVRFIKWKSTP